MTLEKTENVLCDRNLLDLTGILLLNNAHAKETSVLDVAGLTSLLDMAIYVRGVDGGATAILVALDHNATNVNPNFLWFKTYRRSFVYIDRIIVSNAARGKGLAKRLYEDLSVAAERAGHDRLVCEVNVEPPNPISDAFHLAMGFEEVGRATIHGGTKTVRYFEKMLRSPGL